MTLVLKKPVIAVTGSSGKTTTKEMIASILKRRWRVYKSEANRNNRQHINRHVKNIRTSHQAVVLEFGMSARGHIRQSCHIIQPNMAVITMIGTAHIGNLGGSVANLMRAKSEIIQNMKQSGTLFLNADDEYSKRLNFSNFKGTIIKVGIRNSTNYQATDVHYVNGGMVFKVKLANTSCQFKIPIYGTHNVYNALFAIAVADRLGFSPSEIKKGLSSFHKQKGRLVVYRLKNNVRIIDDTFNANPNSVKAAINVLNNIGGQKRFLVLSSMSELGKYTQKGHQEVGKHIANHRVSRVYTLGRNAKIIGETAITHGFPPEKVAHSNDRSKIHKKLKTAIKPGTTILVKGSHDMQMNKTVRYLKQNLN